MIYLEMSRDEIHGGDSWAFGKCVWAPAKKRNGGKWPFWSKILDIKKGDTIIHLRGIHPNAQFIGYSTASTHGFRTRQRPPEPGVWSYADEFFRADIVEFTPFKRSFDLSTVLEDRKLQLTDYFEKNRRQSKKRNIFFVKQSGRLQCLNGAYLSEVEGDLLSALFDSDFGKKKEKGRTNAHSIETGEQIRLIKSRLGQSQFSGRVKNLYGNQCCFPGCTIDDARFLVGSHIARWSDNKKLRGSLANGLCLCVFHDRAFELGLFTLDAQFRVFVNLSAFPLKNGALSQLSAGHGKKISLAEIEPELKALAEHWDRVGLSPKMRERRINT